MGTAILTGLAGVALLNVYAAALVVLRSRLYGTKLYRPMLVNIALSLTPLVLSGVVIVGTILLLAAGAGGLPSRPILYLVVSGLAFVVFFPNSIYLITELNFSHRKDDDGVPIWFDIVQTLTLTLSGIVNAILALALVQTFAIVVVEPDLMPAAPPWWSWAVAAAVLLLGSFGVYIGRNLRLNSWDVLRPWRILGKLGRHLRPEGRQENLALYVLLHTLLIGLLYVMVYAPIYILVLGWAYAGR